MPNKFVPGPRQWGTRFDFLPSSPPSPPKSDGSNIQEPTSDPRSVELDASAVKRKHEKMPHDASVFVGSLPPHIDHNELVRLLTGHLSEHAEVKCIKVIRDNKGGTCAFVQCQDAASAARLIHTLHFSPPKPFLGRHLRYEPARAFRTLLISYCVPMHHIMATENNTMDNGITGNTIELDLPSAMRITRSKHSRSHTIHYNNLAIELERKVGHACAPPVEQDLHLEPLVFDVKTIKTICLYFGPLETFESFPDVGNATEDIDWTLFPAPHNTPRKPNMDKRVFEVKWEHRDDCISALITLRRVPHLRVNWSHTSPPTSTGSPKIRGPVPQHGDQPICLPIAQCRIGSHPAASQGHPFREPFQGPEWNPQSTTLPHEDSARTLVAETGGSWSKIDHPPLVASKELPDSDVWHGNRILDAGQKLDSVCVVTKGFGEMELERPPAVLESCAFTALDISDRPTGDNESEMPAAPALTMSPATPKSPFLLTPANSEGYENVVIPKQFAGVEIGNFHNGVNPGERALDTTTLFVGGLELNGPGAWDENKVRKYFEKFEGLQNVRIIRPANGKAAFAFVKFDNTESPARAIRQEHNRIYQGRAMRVQFREYNFSRGTFMRGRGRGRFTPIQAPVSHTQGMQPQHIRADVSADLTMADMSISTADRTRTDEFTPIPGECDNPPPETAAPDVLGVVSAQTNEFAQKAQGLDFPNLTRENSQTSIEGVSHPERYREWYEINVSQHEVPSANATPPPTTPLSGPESATNGAHHPVPSPAGYYASSSWMQPFPPQMQYPVPYVPGYPVYPVPNPSQPTYPNSSGSDSHVPSSTTPIQWPVYGPYIPYPSPYPSRPPHTAEQPMPPQGPSQPPVVPSGFLQGEQGTLIAVYRQDVLDHYMHQSVGSNLPPLQSHIPHMWPQYPPPPYPIAASGQAPPRTTPISGYQPPKQALGSVRLPWATRGARSGPSPPVVFNNGNANVAIRENDGHGGAPKRGRRDGPFHQRNGYSRQGLHRHGRGASFVHHDDLAANSASNNPTNSNNCPIKPFHLS